MSVHQVPKILTFELDDFKRYETSWSFIPIHSEVCRMGDGALMCIPLMIGTEAGLRVNESWKTVTTFGIVMSSMKSKYQNKPRRQRAPVMTWNITAGI